MKVLRIVSYIFERGGAVVTHWTRIQIPDSNSAVSTAVGQAVACAPVTQRARVRAPVGTCFLGEVYFRVFLTCKTNVR